MMLPKSHILSQSLRAKVLLGDTIQGIMDEREREVRWGGGKANAKWNVLKLI